VLDGVGQSTREMKLRVLRGFLLWHNNEHLAVYVTGSYVFVHDTFQRK